MLQPIAVRRLEMAGHPAGVAHTAARGYFDRGPRALALGDRGYLSMQLELAQLAVTAGWGPRTDRA